MPRFDKANLLLGLGCVLCAAVIVFVWVPLDTTTGLVEKVRRQFSIGDALAPTVAALFLMIGGATVVLFEPADSARRLTRGNLRFVAALLLVLGVGLTAMRWLGPSVAAVLTDEGYRVLRDTAPWKHLGFVVGGAVLVAGLIGLVEGRLSLRSVLIGVAATLGLILVYDVPFDDLLLPPNGDV